MLERPAWLPPLNSHENYSINVDIYQSSVNENPTQSLKFINLLFDVDVKFYSERQNRSSPLYGLVLCRKIKIPAQSDVELGRYVKGLLENSQIVPFKLDKIGCYRETNELKPALDQPQSQHDLVNRITDFLSCTMTRYSQQGVEKLSVVLMIVKSVTVPDREFGAWTAWYEEQKRVDGCFEGRYWSAICKPRIMEELWYESSLRMYESAADSCIESLEKLSLGDSEKRSPCTICLEELGKGEQVTKLACSHVFHAHCVIHWLKISRFCPLCRLMLSKSS